MSEISYSVAEFTFGRSFRILLSFGWRRLVAGILFDLPIMLCMVFLFTSFVQVFFFLLLFIQVAGNILISIAIMRMVLQLSYADFHIVLLPKEDLAGITRVKVTWGRALKVWWSLGWRMLLVWLIFFFPLYWGVQTLRLPKHIVDMLVLISSPFIFYYFFSVILKKNYSDFGVRILENG